jgi:hypothetical protein
MPSAALSGISGFLQGFAGVYVPRELKRDAEERAQNVGFANTMAQLAEDGTLTTLPPDAAKIFTKAYGKEHGSAIADVVQQMIQQNRPGHELRDQLTAPPSADDVGGGLRAAGVGSLTSGAPGLADVLRGATDPGATIERRLQAHPLAAGVAFGPQTGALAAKGAADARASALTGRLVDTLGTGGGGRLPPGASLKVGPLTLRGQPDPGAASDAAEAKAEATARGHQRGLLGTPITKDQMIAAEVKDRGLTGVDASKYARDMRQREAADITEARAGVKEQYRRPSAATEKTLNDIGAAQTVVTRMREALADPVLGPEIVASRGVLSGRAIDLARRYGFSQGQAKDLWGTLLAQAEIIAVQPYIRGVRRYEFIKDARQHIPQPGEELPLTLTKLDEMEKLFGSYRSLALFYDRPVGLIKRDLGAKVDPSAWLPSVEPASPEASPQAAEGAEDDALNRAFLH